MPNAERSVLGRFGIPLGLLLLFFCPFLFTEGKKEKKETVLKSQFTFRVPVNVVVVNATVTDKAGNPVTDLTANDFRVYDDGKPQDTPLVLRFRPSIS